MNRLTKAIRPHYNALAYFATRDLPFRLATGLLICLICLYAGHLTAALVLGIGIVATNLALYALFTSAGRRLHLSRGQTMRAALIIANITMSLYLIPCVLLASVTSMALQLVSLLCLMGVQIYVSNRMSRVPVFLNSMLAVWTVLMLIVAFRLLTTPSTATYMGEFWIAALFVAIFGVTVFWVLREHSASEAHLLRARQEADNRLNLLEASHRIDHLTGVLNRTAFDASLDDMLHRSSRGTGDVAVFLVDLDSFKPINDTYSHDAGDTVLCHTATRLLDHMGPDGLVGRLGGDEFICALADVSDKSVAAEKARNIVQTLSEPIGWNDRQLRIGASIGFALTGQGDPANDTVSALCAAADQAMFAAKSAPNGEPVFYQADLFKPRMPAEDMQLLADGLTTGAIRTFYQPKCNLKTGEIVGLEALARWEHPSKGLRPPADFIDQINEMGLQGDFMIAQAKQVAADVNTMLSAGLNPGQVSVNLPEVALATYSGRTDLHRVVASNPEAARHLTFEITENVFIARAAGTIQTSIASFRALGVRISLDDFGTGFASFHHLQQLDFDELKIDTTFVDGLGRDATAEVLVSGFLNIASGLGVSVVAEGVETDAQSRDLQNMGCIVGQGHLFSPAVPLEDVVSQLTAQQAA